MSNEKKSINLFDLNISVFIVKFDCDELMISNLEKGMKLEIRPQGPFNRK